MSVRGFRVCVRRTEASDRCRLKGDGVLRADVDALHLIDKSGDIVLTWPYRYLRRFGRDKVTPTHAYDLFCCMWSSWLQAIMICADHVTTVGM